MARTDRNQVEHRHSRVQARPRKATVVHEGAGFQLAADLRLYGFEVAEGPLLSSSAAHGDPGSLAVIATRPGTRLLIRLKDVANSLLLRPIAAKSCGVSRYPLLPIQRQRSLERTSS